MRPMEWHATPPPAYAYPTFLDSPPECPVMSRGLLILAASVLPLVAQAAPVPKLKETPPQKMARLFGAATLPDDTCKAEMAGDALRLSGGGTEHVWHAGPEGMKIPFVGREVRGDFVLTVRVKAVDLPEAGSVTGVAGLFLMGDGNTTLDHSLYLTGNRDQASRRGWLRVTAAGNQVNTKEDQNEAFKADELSLKVERVGTKVTASVSADGKEWAELAAHEMALDKAVTAGVFVAHTGGPFAAEFREFTVTKK